MIDRIEITVISLPLNQHENLQGRVAAFTDAVLASSPTSSGLERRIFQLPNRLHMTLGVMNLVTNPEVTRPAFTDGAESAGRTLEEALALLRGLRPEILQLLDGAGAITVPLKGLAIMTGKKEEAFVAYTGPGGALDDSVMWKICLLIQDRFKVTGLITETRPLKLHCTLLNSSFRQPRSPFSFTSVLQAVQRHPSIAGIPPRPNAAPITLTQAEGLPDFGTWSIDEIHIWKMGSWDKEGRYVSSGYISLREPE
ncbi:hypothetical protein FRB96_003692 [Tulasnella sp. 330]|nr:hypothetical protein FRB96_003692 [Tulasnella sp. 330]